METVTVIILIVFGAALAWLGGKVRGARALGLNLGLRMVRARPGQRHLESVDRISLSPNHSLHLIRVAQQALVIAVHPTGCVILDQSAYRPHLFPETEPGRREAQHAG